MYNQLENSTSHEDLSFNSMQERSDRSAREDMKHPIPPVFQKEQRPPTSWRSSNTPFLCIACGAKTELYIKDSMRFSFSEIHSWQQMIFPRITCLEKVDMVMYTKVG